MSIARRRGWLLLAPVLAVLAPVVAWLMRDGAVLVHRCVSDGAAGQLGLRMALVRTEVDCPSGLALGAEGRTVTAIALMVAVPVLLAHLAGACAGLGTAAVVASALAAVARVLGARRRLPARDVAVGPVDEPRTAVLGRTWSVVPVGAGRAPWRRGPPALALA
ncbi:hypothetical protein GXB85_16505 [Cellulomonas sp. APG4]|uniref:hypothetical protein n=1 Tax=Cellulomonas sp. APG4 TaxID=1538656 RepID=UPI001379C573|nr:hypothetical protein [Cellulomonas sp. APG4]NCT92538.1 hypothetical protein [Cellulomonas sp. APG4]